MKRETTREYQARMAERGRRSANRHPEGLADRQLWAKTRRETVARTRANNEDVREFESKDRLAVLLEIAFADRARVRAYMSDDRSPAETATYNLYYKISGSEARPLERAILKTREIHRPFIERAEEMASLCQKLRKLGLI